MRNIPLPPMTISHPATDTSDAYKAGHYRGTAEWLSKYAEELHKEIATLEATIEQLRNK